MRTSARRLLFLSGTLTLVICAVFYTKSRQNGLNSQLAAGDSTVLQVTWTNSSPSEQEALPVEPACSLRKGVRKDVLLKDQFQFSVPVLQWAGSLSAKTWKELKNRAPPYGWRGLPVDVLGSALLLLNSSHLLDRGSPDRCVRCAVVGNGGILRGSRRGRDIDNHDLVFRMNGAITEGFEEDVGTKISFYGFTTNSMKNALRLYGADGLTRIPQHPDIKYIFIPSDLRDYVMMAAAVHGQTVDSDLPSILDINLQKPSRCFIHSSSPT